MGERRALVFVYAFFGGLDPRGDFTGGASFSTSVSVGFFGASGVSIAASGVVDTGAGSTSCLRALRGALVSSGATCGTSGTSVR